jgi:tetratricopeptide (TPR) repeat protein
VDYQQLADPEPKFYKKAIEMHLKHKEIADTSGKFISHVNLGIIYNMLGDQEKSNINHQFALRYAVQMSSIPGQKVALGNLGKIGSINFSSNPEKLMSFVENYMELNEKDREQDPNAYLRLGELLSIKGKYDESSKQFYKAISIAEKDGNKAIKNEAVINYGMATANATWGNKCKEITQQFKNYNAENDSNEDQEEEYQDTQSKLQQELMKINADNPMPTDNSTFMV